MFNLNQHNNFNHLKDYLKNFQSSNFEDFLKESLQCADVIAASITKDNMDVYGFNYFDKQYYPNNLQLLYTHIKNKVIGDIFELFAGFFVQYFETGTPWGIRRGTYNFGGDMADTFESTDLGMDGFGTFMSTNETAVMQVKYRSNPKDHPFDKNVFCSLFTEAIIKRKIQYDNANQRLIFFTNIPVGDKNSWDAKTKQFNNMRNECTIPTVIIGYNEIIINVGSSKNKTSNTDFWNIFYKSFN